MNLRLQLGLTALGVLALAGALTLGSTPLGLGPVLKALVHAGLAADQIVVWEIRLPRALCAYGVGAALGLAGAAMQGLLRNPLADPGVLGVSATASLAATGVIYWGIAARFPIALPAAAVVGALVGVCVLVLAAMSSRSVTTLLLVGLALASFSGAVMALMLNFAPDPFYLSDMINWSLGSVENRSLRDLALVLPIMALGAIILLSQGQNLFALTLGEEAASGVGLDLGRARFWIVAGAGLVTGAAVSLAGAVGFVGLVAPYLVRPWVNHHPARTLLPSALVGGLLLVLADIAVRILPTQFELKLGVMAALVGAPIFALIAMRRGLLDG